MRRGKEDVKRDGVVIVDGKCILRSDVCDGDGICREMEMEMEIYMMY